MTAKISQITLATTAAGGDWVEIERAADGLSRRISKDNLIGAVLTGGGAVATGGFTLTLPATGTAALLGTANVFTANQRMNALVGINAAPATDAQVNILSGAAERIGLRLDTAPSATAPALQFRRNGVDRANMLSDTTNILSSFAVDNGDGMGTHILLAQNNNATTSAAAFIVLARKSGAFRRIWVDDADQVRIHSANPTHANDTAGTVVGSQSSWIGLKKDVELWSGDDALSTILETPLYSYQLRDDAGNPGRVYHGLVIENRDEWFATNTGENQIPALDERSLFGYLIASIQALNERIQELEAKVE